MSIHQKLLVFPRNAPIVTIQTPRNFRPLRSTPARRRGLPEKSKTGSTRVGRARRGHGRPACRRKVGIARLFDTGQGVKRGRTQKRTAPGVLCVSFAISQTPSATRVRVPRHSCFSIAFHKPVTNNQPPVWAGESHRNGEKTFRKKKFEKNQENFLNDTKL
jgi:hypothetical protein